MAAAASTTASWLAGASSAILNAPVAALDRLAITAPAILQAVNALETLTAFIAANTKTAKTEEA